MKKRALGAGAIILVALGIWLGNLFQGPGLGENGADSSDSNGENVQVSFTGDGAQPTAMSENGDNEPADETPDVLTVLVDDDKYLIQSGADWYADFAPATLEEIISSVGEYPGDENGVRIRMRFTENAQNGVINDLKSALTEAGVDPEAIIEDPEYVE